MNLSLQDINPDFMNSLRAVMAVAQGRRQPSCWGYLGATAYFDAKGLRLPSIVPKDKELRALNLLSEMHKTGLYLRPANQLPAFKGGMDTVIGYAGSYLFRAFGVQLQERPSAPIKEKERSSIRHLQDQDFLSPPTIQEVLLEIQRLRQEVHTLLQPNAARLSA
ncbi:MAG: hypothetical protein AB8H12_03125 [Lewinella sp.]